MLSWVLKHMTAKPIWKNIFSTTDTEENVTFCIGRLLMRASDVHWTGLECAEKNARFHS